MSLFGLTRQLNTFCVFHPMYHQILGLSSRKVSLTKNNLTFRTSRMGLVAHVLFTIQAIIHVHDVEFVNVLVNVNSCRVVVAVKSEEK